jgi:hypothetical protein
MRTRNGVKILDSRGVALESALPLSLCLFAAGASLTARITEEGIFYLQDRDMNRARTEKSGRFISSLLAGHYIIWTLAA